MTPEQTAALTLAMTDADHSDPKQWEADGSPNLVYLASVAGFRVTPADCAEVQVGWKRSTEIALDPRKAATPEPIVAPKNAEEDSQPDTDTVGKLVAQKAYSAEDAVADQIALDALQPHWQEAITDVDAAKVALDLINKERDRLITRLQARPSTRNQDFHAMVKLSQEQSLKDNQERVGVNAAIKALTGGATTKAFPSPLDARLANTKSTKRAAQRMGMKVA